MHLNMFECHGGTDITPLDDLTSFFDVHKHDSGRRLTEIEINGHSYHKHIILEQMDIVVRIVRKNWMYILGSLPGGRLPSISRVKKCREEINSALRLVIVSLQQCDVSAKKGCVEEVSKHVKTFSQLVLSVAELEKHFGLSLTSVTIGKENSAEYHFFHIFQEVHYQLLLLEYVSGNLCDLEVHLERIMGDLVLLSSNEFSRRSKSAFTCTCNKDFWLILQHLCEKVLGEEVFWAIFNKAVDNKDPRFVLWLMPEIATLYITKANFTLLEMSLKKLLDTTDAPILENLKSIEPLLCHSWLSAGRIEVYQILWDFFSKKLNYTKSNGEVSTAQLVELMDTILWTPKNCGDDFEMFLSLLCAHLVEHPLQWSRMKGRIYSQLGPNKLKELSNVGISNVLLMYLCLTKVNFEEVSKKFLGLLEGLSHDRKQSSITWSFYSAYIIRSVRENRSIEPMAPSFVKLLEDASTKPALFSLLKSFVIDFEMIFNSSQNLQLHQWLLLNTWIHKYMGKCYYPDLVYLVTMLLNCLERLISEEVWGDWEKTFKDYVYPSLKHVAVSKVAPEVCGILAGKMALLSGSLLAESFAYFNGESVQLRVCSNFLCLVLGNYILNSQQEVVAVQSWARICLLTRDNYGELTKKVVKLDIFPPLVKTELIKANDPLIALIENLGNNVRLHAQSTNIMKLCDIIFGQADRWIASLVQQPDSEVIIMRIYTCIGLAFYKIGPLLYSKHRSNCPFERLVTTLLLPTELLIGKPLNPFVLQSVRKTWHLFFEAALKFNTDDAYIERILREMVVKYIPHFSTADSPMLKCLDNEALADVILDKMAAAFFKHPSKEAESSVFKALKIVNEFLQSTTSAALMMLVIKRALYGLFEIVMLHSQKNMALTVIKSMTQSPVFGQCKADFNEVLCAVGEKRLAFNTANYFQMMDVLVKAGVCDLKGVLPRLREQIANVERMRGIGFDKVLRVHLGRLEATLL